ncbi:flavin-containing monooxygenase FMO GS-OX-like 8 [Miscanthus floridulus]|uniref:flavin-containing monooxygenase FMO GS-OX-like 8 n=1 Tax=Miscanthus floridulus TaxID=154761 RepID=UPI003457A5A0
MASSSKKVCVVGAGVAGLVSARELRREGHDVTVMEQSGGVGGQWLYDPRTDATDPLGVAGAQSSIYASLRLNTPRETTAFSDFPFFPSNDCTGDARRYPVHAEFLRYIRDFCDAFGLMDVVRLNTKVLHVGPLAPRAADDGGVKRWTVRWSSRHGDCEGEVVTAEKVFDAVVVAVGQNTQPRLPTINGMDKWSRKQLHSHSYQAPDAFEDQVVVVVGCHPSGTDFALELREVAREVHISVKSMDDGAVVPGMRKAVSRHHNLHLHLQVECLCEDGQVTFADGSCVVADSIIYCTGYDFSFPFLDTGGLVTIDDNRVGPLFEHTFPPALAPSLSFVGVPRLVVVPRFYEAQARWVAQVLSGRSRLPPEDEMLRSAEEYHRAREAAGVPRRLSHSIFFDMDYCDEFGAKRCGFPLLPEWKKELLCSSVARLRDATESFRDDYRDSDLVREGLQAQGWHTGRPPPPPEDTRVENESLV